MRKIVFHTVLNLLIAAFFLVSGNAQANTAVALRSSTEINRSSIRLSDVFMGVPEEIDRVIATAPAPGKSVAYNVKILNQLADQYRLDWQPESLADRAVLTRAATYISTDMIRAAVADKLAASKIKGKTEVAFDNRAITVALPADRSPNFTLINFNYDEQYKRFRAEIQAETGAAPIIVPVTGRVSIKRGVPVLARRLERGTTVGEADVQWLTVPEEHISSDVLTDARDLVGRELRHDMAEDQLIRARDVMQPRLVTRGSLVIMKVETSTMLMTAQGRAMQDGASGDVIRLTNTQSNRVVEGVVVGAGVVRIPTAQKLALAQ